MPTVAAMVWPELRLLLLALLMLAVSTAPVAAEGTRVASHWECICLALPPSALVSQSPASNARGLCFEPASLPIFGLHSLTTTTSTSSSTSSSSASSGSHNDTPSTNTMVPAPSASIPIPTAIITENQEQTLKSLESPSVTIVLTSSINDASSHIMSISPATSLATTASSSSSSSTQAYDYIRPTGPLTTSTTSIPIPSSVPVPKTTTDRHMPSYEQWRLRAMDQKKNNPNSNNSPATATTDRKQRRRKPYQENAIDAGVGDEIAFDFAASDSSLLQQQQRQNELNDLNQKLGSPATEIKLGDDGDQRRDGRTWIKAEYLKDQKDRFNHASSTCAAGIVKASKDATSTSAILHEGKDNYMLIECSTRDKFFVVELCEEILVDTFVIGNYEFFSSTFKDFTVSVNRYPPRDDGWQILGHFQARNSRDAQVFIPQEPKLATFIRFDFHSHYGIEYYCPVTLVRVYGATALEQLKQEEEEEKRQAEEEQRLAEMRKAEEEAIEAGTGMYEYYDGDEEVNQRQDEAREQQQQHPDTRSHQKPREGKDEVEEGQDGEEGVEEEEIMMHGESSLEDFLAATKTDSPEEVTRAKDIGNSAETPIAANIPIERRQHETESEIQDILDSVLHIGIPGPVIIHHSPAPSSQDYHPPITTPTAGGEGSLTDSELASTTYALPDPLSEDEVQPLEPMAYDDDSDDGFWGHSYDEFDGSVDNHAEDADSHRRYNPRASSDDQRTSSDNDGSSSIYPTPTASVSGIPLSSISPDDPNDDGGGGTWNEPGLGVITLSPKLKPSHIPKPTYIGKSTGAGGTLSSANVPAAATTPDSVHGGHHVPAASSSQESVYKNIVNRLKALELNASLSYQYLEEQSNVFNDVLAGFDDSSKQLVHHLNEANRRLEHLGRKYDRLAYAFKVHDENEGEKVRVLSSQFHALGAQMLFQRQLFVIVVMILFSIFAFLAVTRNSAIPFPVHRSPLVSKGKSGQMAPSSSSIVNTNFSGSVKSRASLSLGNMNNLSKVSTTAAVSATTTTQGSVMGSAAVELADKNPLNGEDLTAMATATTAAASRKLSRRGSAASRLSHRESFSNATNKPVTNANEDSSNVGDSLHQRLAILAAQDYNSHDESNVNERKDSSLASNLTLSSDHCLEDPIDNQNYDGGGEEDMERRHGEGGQDSGNNSTDDLQGRHSDSRELNRGSSNGSLGASLPLSSSGLRMVSRNSSNSLHRHNHSNLLLQTAHRHNSAMYQDYSPDFRPESPIYQGLSIDGNDGGHLSDADVAYMSRDMMRVGGGSVDHENGSGHDSNPVTPIMSKNDDDLHGRFESHHTVEQDYEYHQQLELQQQHQLQRQQNHQQQDNGIKSVFPTTMRHSSLLRSDLTLDRTYSLPVDSPPSSINDDRGSDGSVSAITASGTHVLGAENGIPLSGQLGQEQQQQQQQQQSGGEESSPSQTQISRPTDRLKPRISSGTLLRRSPPTQRIQQPQLQEQQRLQYQQQRLQQPPLVTFHQHLCHELDDRDEGGFVSDSAIETLQARSARGAVRGFGSPLASSNDNSHGVSKNEPAHEANDDDVEDVEGDWDRSLGRGFSIPKYDDDEGEVGGVREPDGGSENEDGVVPGSGNHRHQKSHSAGSVIGLGIGSGEGNSGKRKMTRQQQSRNSLGHAGHGHQNQQQQQQQGAGAIDSQILTEPQMPGFSLPTSEPPTMYPLRRSNTSRGEEGDDEHSPILSRRKDIGKK